MKILDARNLLDGLYRQLDSLGDYFTSAGIFPKNKKRNTLNEPSEIS